MKNPAKNKIRALLLSAATALLSTHAQAEETATLSIMMISSVRLNAHGERYSRM